MNREIRLAEAFYQSVLRSQFLPEDEMSAYQSRLIGPLYRHAIEHVPFYKNRERLEDGIDPGNPSWQQIPFTTRADVARNPAQFKPSELPSQHGEVFAVQSGGSTGTPVRLDLTVLEKFARTVLTFRAFHQWGLDPSLPMFMLRKAQAGSQDRTGIGQRKWAYPWLPEQELGDRVHVNITTPRETQIARLLERHPCYINTLPSNILRLGCAAHQHNLSPEIPFIISVAEYLAPEVRKLAQDMMGSRVIDVLSSSEAGVIAIECPQSGMYHIQSESVVVEIINNDGEACQEGEVGELVVTALYNYAFPIIRYRSGDYVVKGHQCSCGARLPTIAKMVGRREHMFHFRDGRQEVPGIDRVRTSDLAGQETWQLVQIDSKTVEFRHSQTDMSPGKWKQIEELIYEALRDDEFRLIEVSECALPLTSGAKRHFCLNEAKN